MVAARVPTCFRDIEIAHRACTVCHLGNLAYWLNRSLQWDPDTEQIQNDSEAARWLDRPKRGPWTLDGTPSAPAA